MFVTALFGCFVTLLIMTIMQGDAPMSAREASGMLLVMGVAWILDYVAAIIIKLSCRWSWWFVIAAPFSIPMSVLGYKRQIEFVRKPDERIVVDERVLLLGDGTHAPVIIGDDGGDK